MEALLDIAAGTGVVLFLLAAASIERTAARWLAVTAVAAAAWALHPIAVRQSLAALVAAMDGAGIQTLAVVLAVDGLLGCAGATALLRMRRGPPLHRLRRMAAHHVGVVPALALFYLEMKVFHAASAWSFAATALALCAGVVLAGLAASGALRRLLPDRRARVELRLLVHVGQVMLAAGLTAFALQGAAGSGAASPEAAPHAVVAGVAVLGILIGYGSHRRRLRGAAGRASWNC